MGLFGKLGLGGKGRGSTQGKFMKVLSGVDLGISTTEQTLASKLEWYKLGVGYTVPAQQMIRWGYGTPELPDNQGYLYIHLKSTGDETATGAIRLIQSNAQETKKFVVAEFNLAVTRGSLTNKAMQIALPEQLQFPLVGEDSLIWLEMKADTDGETVDVDTSTVYIPVSIYI